MTDATIQATALRAAIALLACLTVGCDKPAGERAGLVPVSGVVLLDGAPVAEASVVFGPATGGKAAVGQTDHDGRFQLTTFEPNDGALAGDYIVTVEKTQTTGAMTTAERYAYLDRTGKNPPPPKTEYVVPRSYGAPESSGLHAAVKPGQSDPIRLELQGERR